MAFRALALWLLLATAATAAPPSDLVAALDRVVAQQRQGGWLFWSPPGARPEPLTYLLRWAERIGGWLGAARWDVIVLRSPGTPAAGVVLLAGHRRTGRPEYLAAARRAGDLLVATQLASGGWFSEMPVEDGELAGWFALLERRVTIDDDVTPGATRFLLELSEVTGETRYRAAAERGLALLLEAQLPSGAWPLVVRPRWEHAVVDSFEDYATLNDGATTHAIETLLVAARILRRDELAAAARRGGE